MLQASGLSLRIWVRGLGRRHRAKAPGLGSVTRFRAFDISPKALTRWICDSSPRPQNHRNVNVQGMRRTVKGRAALVRNMQ